MYKLYAIITTMLLTLFVNGCHKVPTFHADNEADSLHELFELSPPENFWYESVNTSTLYGVQLKWTKPHHTVHFDGYILKTYNDSLKIFNRIDTLSTKNTDYYVGSTDTLGLELKYELHTYIGVFEDSIKVSKPLPLQVDQSITNLDVELIDNNFQIKWLTNILSKSAKIFLERSINDEAYTVVSEFDINTSSYFDDFNFSAGDLIQYKMYAKTNYSTSDTVYASNLGIVVIPPLDVELISSTDTDIKFRILNPAALEKYQFTFLSEIGHFLSSRIIEAEEGEWTTVTLDVAPLPLNSIYELQISSMVKDVISEPFILRIKLIPELNYETHFSLDSSLGVTKPFFSKDGERIIFVNNHGAGWRPEIWSVNESKKLRQLPDIDNPQSIYIDVNNEYIFATKNDSLYKWDFNENELNKYSLPVNLFIHDIIVLSENNNAFIILEDSILAYNLSTQLMSSHEGYGKLKLSPNRDNIYIINKDYGLIHKLLVTDFENILNIPAEIVDYNVFITNDYIFSITHDQVILYRTYNYSELSNTISDDFHILSNDAVELFYGTHDQRHLIAVFKRYDQSKRIHFLARDGKYLGLTNLPMINHLTFDNEPIWIKYSPASNRFVLISKKYFYFFQVNYKWGILN